MNERIAAIVVNWNAGRWLRECVGSLLEQTRPADRIVVVDNASSDDSLTPLADLSLRGVEVIRLDENLGFSAANNIGIELCKDCDWVALLNPDATADPRWLEVLSNHARNSLEYRFFASRQIMTKMPELLDGTGDAYHVSGLHWRRSYNESIATALEPREVFSPCGAAALYRTDLFHEVGGFDENFFCYGEDVDLGFRLRLRGYKCLYVPEAVIYHVGSAVAGRRSDFTIYHGHRNLVWVFFKNMPQLLLWLYLPQHLMLNLASIVWFAIHGRARVILKAKWDAIKGLPRVWDQRRKLQAARKVGVWELRRQMAQGWLTPYSRRRE